MKDLARAVIALFVLVGAASAVHAQSTCWNHNGSTMRVTFNGANLTIAYERPRDVLRRAGVRRGTLLLDARDFGGEYVGTARRFSRHCPGTPLEYGVSGQMYGDYELVFEGSRQVHRRCRPTGERAFDELVFEYTGRC